MGQEFIIKSQGLEDKINQLLPSQGGFQAGVDLSASTQIIPIVDLTETAEGSSLRQDLQTSISFNTSTVFGFSNTTSTLINTTGYFRVFGNCYFSNASASEGRLLLNDGASTKNILIFTSNGLGEDTFVHVPFDFTVKLEAGHSLQGVSSISSLLVNGVTRQIADLSGNLVDP